MRFVLPARTQSEDVVVGRVFFDNVWDDLGDNDCSGPPKKLYKTKVLLFVNLEVSSARSRKFSYDDGRNDKFVILVGCVFYPSGTVVDAFYAGGATLEEVRVTHPLAVVEVFEDSRVSVA
jgi:hypothetical protein